MAEIVVIHSKLEDSELLALAEEGDRAAEETLIRRYNWLVRVSARPLFLMGGDFEDLVQEGLMGLLSAIREYDESRSVSFRTYAEICIRNRLYSAVKAASRDKHVPLNSYVPLDPSLFDSLDSEERRTVDRLQVSPETMLIRREDTEERMKQIYSMLSPLETRVLDGYLSGLSYSEIAEKCGKTVKAVDNAIQRIRKKIGASFHDGVFSSY